MANALASHAEGESTVASGMTSHAEGCGSKANSNYAHAEGKSTTASNLSAHSQGEGTTASGMVSHAEGYYSTAAGHSAHAEGCYTNAGGHYSHAAGFSTTANELNYVIGKYNKAPINGNPFSSTVTGDAFVIGNGASGLLSNAFRVNFAGNTYGTGAFNSTGADYAETTEWLDENPNNEDRAGLFVTLNGEKMKLTNDPDDDVAGIISAVPAVVGDNYADDWHGKYKVDVFGRRLIQHNTYDAVKDANGNIIQDAYEEDEWVLNADFDPSKEYIPRDQRPEFGHLGIVGKLVLVDDESCIPDGYAMPKKDGNGVGTTSEKVTRFRVMKRLDDAHVLVFAK